MTSSIIITILIIGLLAGTLSGLIGIGGGIILVPCLVYFLNYTQHQAQGTSMGVLMFPVILLAFLTFYSKLKNTPESINFNVIGLLAIGFVLGSLLGSNLALKLEAKTLKSIFAIILFYTGFKMLGWDNLFFNFFKNKN